MRPSAQSNSPRTLENRIILACARTGPDTQCIRNLVDRGPNWEEILRKAERFGLAPLLYTNLRQIGDDHPIPKLAIDRLRQLYHRDAASSINKREALRAILLRFREARIPVIILKGAAMAALVYPSPALRTMGDIDLLVQNRDLGQADELLHAAGYSLASGEPFVPGSTPARHHEIPYLGPNGFPLVEIHHHIFNAAFARIPIEDFWQRSRAAEVASVEALVFSNEDLLLHLALHLMLHLIKGDGFFAYVRSLCDIREVCKSYGTVMDWDRLVTQARAYRVEKHLYHSMRLACDLVEAYVPSRTLVALRAGSPHLPLENKFIAAITRRVILAEDKTRLPPWTFYKISADLMSATSGREGIAIAGRQLARLCQTRVRRGVTWIWPKLFRGTVASAGEATESIDHSQRACDRQTAGELAVTYDSAPTDGVGAQLQRIYGLYALSRALQVKYVHTPLRRVEYQGFLPLLTGQNDPHFAERYNSFFSLASDPFDMTRCERINVDHISKDMIDRYREHAAQAGRPVLLQALSGYRYTDRNPEAYHLLRKVTPYKGHRATGAIRVCMHVRRADNSLPGRTDRRYRWLPNNYYLRVCGTVVDLLRRLEVSFVIRLHTEAPPRTYTLHPGLPGLYCTLDHPTTISPADDALEEFESLPNLEMILNGEPKQSLDDFGTADILILSRSSFSYLGGLLNPHGLVIYAPWTHSAVPGWLVAGEEGELDPSALEARVAELVNRRTQLC